jgi:formylmethanofuran dehydrogenase subunit A
MNRPASLHIRGGRIIDPSVGRDEIADLWIDGDRIIDAPPQIDAAGKGASMHQIDAADCIVMAGGIDLHTHIGGGKLSIARAILGRELADDPVQSYLMTASQTASRYLDMGYTTCLEPAVIPVNARAAHAEMADVRGIDTGGYCLLGNEDALLAMVADDVDQSVINAYVATMVMATQCLAVKVVNAGGISAFKFNARMMDVDTPHPTYGVTPGKIIRTLARAVDEIGLAHPLHVHCSNLGVPGNIDSTLATIKAADGHRLHLTHAQFHSYGKTGAGMSSAAAVLAHVVNTHPNLTIDVGQIIFGQTVTISADSMHQYDNLPFAKPRKGVIADIECEAGCGVVPFRYRKRRFVHALQWAIGLELFLMIDDPNRVFLTTDHPNGGPFTSYPHLIRLLGDRTFRNVALAEIDTAAADSSQLSGIDREYSIAEIAMMTRSAPANILGLNDRGNLKTGSLADVVIYSSASDLEKQFESPTHVIRRGVVVRGPSGTSAESLGRVPQTTLKADISIDFSPLSEAMPYLNRFGSVPLEFLKISDDEMTTIIGSKPQGYRGARR